MREQYSERTKLRKYAAGFAGALASLALVYSPVFADTNETSNISSNSSTRVPSRPGRPLNLRVLNYNAETNTYSSTTNNVPTNSLPSIPASPSGFRVVSG